MDDKTVEQAAQTIALRCRRAIQAILREEERADCDAEFEAIAKDVLRKLAASIQTG